MIKLFVEEKEVDISKQFSPLLTFAIDDITDFGSKNTTFSKTIILPGTKRNNVLFGNIFDVNVSNNYLPSTANTGLNYNAAVSADAIIFQDNIQIFKGVFRILEIIIDDGFIEYECSVVGELGGFVAKLGNLKLEDLDFSTYNHVYSLANISGSWANTQSGYIYPHIDYGTYSVNKKDWAYGTFRPAFFAWEYLNKIFDNAEYSYVSDLLDSTRLKRLIIPYTKKRLERKSSDQLNVSSNFQNFSVDDNNTTELIAFANQPTLGDFTASNLDRRFTYGGANITGTVTVNFDITVTNNSDNVGTINVYKNGVSILSMVSIFAQTSGNFTSSVSLNNVALVATDYLEVKVVVGGDTATCFVDINSCNLIFGNTGQNYVAVNLGEDIIANDLLPKNILQKDFVSSIVKLFNLYIYESKDLDKTLLIKPFVDYYLNADSEDWSNKIDRSKPIKIKPMGELNARYYNFEFKSDSDYWNDLYKKRYNQTYGSYIYDSQYEFAQETKKISVIFSGTPLVGYDGEDKVYSTIFKLNGVVEENVDSNIRLLQVKRITGVTSWNIEDDTNTTTLTTYTEYCYAGHYDDPDNPGDDIQFGVPSELFFTVVTGALNINQFNVYWSSYMAEITDKDSKLLNAKARLTFRDINNLDFSKLIYIDGSLFRLNKIQDFNVTDEDSCEIELLKVINRIY